MALVDLEFEQPLNVSLQIGDSAYYVDTTAAYTSSQSSASGVSGGVQVNQNSTNPDYIGIIQAVSNARNLPPYTTTNLAPTITVDTTLPASVFHNHSAFIFFSKVYSVGVDTFNSSK